MELFYILFILFLNVTVYSKEVDIFDAVRQDSETLIKSALESGVDINSIGPGGQTPLMHAVLSGKVSSVKTLLKLGADTTIGEKDGYIPIHGAGFQGRAEIAQILIDHGVDPSDKHTDGYMPIHRACWGQEKRHTETVKIFLENGVPFDQKADNGDTPSTTAKKMGNKETIELLKKWSEKSEL